jgi:hypothetical protein
VELEQCSRVLLDSLGYFTPVLFHVFIVVFKALHQHF